MAAVVTVMHLWANGEQTHVRVRVDNSYPDALDQAKATAVRGLIEAVQQIAVDEDE